MGRLAWLGAIFFATVFVINPSAFAQTPPSSTTTPTEQSIEAAYEAAFEEMLRDPGNFDKTFRFAELAVKKGDLEGAISAYSRLLITIPEYWQIRYELGILYFRLKSFGIAKSYLENALKNKNVPANVRKRAEEFNAEIDSQLSSQKFSGTLTAGVRYQTNVNAGSNAAQASQGLTGALRDSFVEKDDFDFFGNLNFNHLYDFDTVSNTVWKSRAQLYGAKQMTEEEFDLVYVESDTGPQFKIGDGSVEGLLVQPFALVDYVRLGQSTLYHSYGAGVRLEKVFGADFIGKLSYDFRDRSFRDKASSPTSSNLDGVIQKIEGDLLYAITKNISTNLRLRGASQNSHEPFESNREIAAEVSATVSFDAPFGLTSKPWQSSLLVEHVRAIYDAPDPSLDATKSRINQQWTIRLVHSIPITDELSAVLSAGLPITGRTSRCSNIAILMGL